MTVDDSNIVEKLMELGLTLREAKLYFALLRVNESTPAELARATDVQRTKIYEILDQMRTKGLCSERQDGQKKYYRATKPSEVNELLSAKWEADKQHRDEPIAFHEQPEGSQDENERNHDAHKDQRSRSCMLEQYHDSCFSATLPEACRTKVSDRAGVGLDLWLA